MTRYHIWTIGCQMNDADSRRAAEELQRLGYLPTPRPEEADIILLNTCVVRQKAEDKVYGRLSSLKPLKERRPEVILAVMGCLVAPETCRDLERRFPYVDLWLSPSEVKGLVEFLKEKGEPVPFTCPVSANVPVATGCDQYCTYCIVRLRRGGERSRPMGEIVEEVRCLVERGVREVTLVGQIVDSYGHDLPGQPTLADLLGEVHEVEGLWRIRFLTSHPNFMNDRLIEAVASLPKVCEHIELPVQAGDDRLLKRMGRRYTVSQYRRLLAKIREHIPGVSLATDLIVGFPEETEEEFRRTYRLLEEERFDVIHVAAYSPRPDTPAARLTDDVPSEVKERRRRALEELQAKIAEEINQALLGETLEVLVEGRQKGKWKGRTRTNKLVFFQDDNDWRGKLAPVQIIWAGPWSMQGSLNAPTLPRDSNPTFLSHH
jgi:tRNA-2-methylthio-N6-dimethylallyladenosine synthase